MTVAQDLHTHPSDVIGVPESRTAYCWYLWASMKRNAEAQAQKSRHVRSSLSRPSPGGRR